MNCELSAIEVIENFSGRRFAAIQALSTGGFLDYLIEHGSTSDEALYCLPNCEWSVWDYGYSYTGLACNDYEIDSWIDKKRFAGVPSPARIAQYPDDIAHIDRKEITSDLARSTDAWLFAIVGYLTAPLSKKDRKTVLIQIASMPSLYELVVSGEIKY